MCGTKQYELLKEFLDAVKENADNDPEKLKEAKEVWDAEWDNLLSASKHKISYDYPEPLAHDLLYTGEDEEDPEKILKGGN
jgi:hypothetical protein